MGMSTVCLETNENQIPGDERLAETIPDVSGGEWKQDCKCCG